MYDRPRDAAGNLGGPVNPAPPHPQEGLPARTQGEIARELEAQEKGTYRLLQVVDELQQRLEPALVPSPPAVKESASTAPKCGSAVAACVQENNLRLQHAIQMVLDIHQRLSL